MLLLKPIFISIVIHLALFGLTKNMGGSKGDNADGSKNKTMMKVSIKEKLDEQDVKTKELTIPGKSKVQKKQEKKKKQEELECDKYYTGIGITVSDNSCMVTQVFRGYPAHKAGILVGDLIVSPACPDIIGPEGTQVSISILRGIRGIHLQITRGKICENK